MKSPSYCQIQTHLNQLMSFKVTCYPKQPILSTHSIKKTYVGKILQWENKNAITKKNKSNKRTNGGNLSNQQTQKTMTHSKPNMKIKYQLKERTLKYCFQLSRYLLIACISRFSLSSIFICWNLEPMMLSITSVVALTMMILFEPIS